MNLFLGLRLPPMGLTMEINKISKLVSKMCAEQAGFATSNLRAPEIFERLSSNLEACCPGAEKKIFRRRSFFPSHHYLEIFSLDGHAVFNLKAGFIDHILAIICFIFGSVSFLAGIWLIISSVLAVASEEHYFSIGCILVLAGVGINVFFYIFYKALRLFSGWSKPLNILEQCGVV